MIPLRVQGEKLAYKNPFMTMDDNPIERYRAEWLHRREIHRQQKRAAKLAKLQAKENERNQRILEGSLTLGDRYKEWKRRRQLRREKELQWLREQADTSPVLLWLREGETKFFLLAALCILGAFGYILYEKQMHIRYLYKRLAGSQTVLVAVGDKTIRKGPFETELWERHADTDLQLETLRLLLEDATEAMDVYADEHKTLADSWRSGRILNLREETDFLEEKYVLSKTRSQAKRDLYEAEKESLAVYHLSVLRFEDSEKAEQFVEAFLKGMTPDRAAETYSLDPRPVRLDPIMDRDLDDELGILRARAVRSLERGRFSEALPTVDDHFVVYKLNHIDTDYDLVLPAINTVLVRRNRKQIRQALVDAAEIESEAVNKKQLVELKL